MSALPLTSNHKVTHTNYFWQNICPQHIGAIWTCLISAHTQNHIDFKIVLRLSTGCAQGITNKTFCGVGMPLTCNYNKLLLVHFCVYWTSYITKSSIKSPDLTSSSSCDITSSCGTRPSTAVEQCKSCTIVEGSLKQRS